MGRTSGQRSADHDTDALFVTLALANEERASARFAWEALACTGPAEQHHAGDDPAFDAACAPFHAVLGVPQKNILFDARGLIPLLVAKQDKQRVHGRGSRSDRLPVQRHSVGSQASEDRESALNSLASHEIWWQGKYKMLFELIRIRITKYGPPRST